MGSGSSKRFSNRNKDRDKQEEQDVMDFDETGSADDSFEEQESSDNVHKRVSVVDENTQNLKKEPNNNHSSYLKDTPSPVQNEDVDIDEVEYSGDHSDGDTNELQRDDSSLTGNDPQVVGSGTGVSENSVSGRQRGRRYSEILQDFADLESRRSKCDTLEFDQEETLKTDSLLWIPCK